MILVVANLSCLYVCTLLPQIIEKQKSDGIRHRHRHRHQWNCLGLSAPIPPETPHKLGVF